MFFLCTWDPLLDVWAAKHASNPEVGSQIEMDIFLFSFDVKVSVELHISAALQIV